MVTDRQLSGEVSVHLCHGHRALHVASEQINLTLVKYKCLNFQKSHINKVGEDEFELVRRDVVTDFFKTSNPGVQLGVFGELWDNSTSKARSALKESVILTGHGRK